MILSFCVFETGFVFLRLAEASLGLERLWIFDINIRAKSPLPPPPPFFPPKKEKICPRVRSTNGFAPERAKYCIPGAETETDTYDSLWINLRNTIFFCFYVLEYNTSKVPLYFFFLKKG